MSTPLFIRSFWDLHETPPVANLQVASRLGYDGFEAGWTVWRDDADFAARVTESGLIPICQGWMETTHDFEVQMNTALRAGAKLFNAHAGHDSWTVTQAVQTLGDWIQRARAAGQALAFETHRGRCLYHPSTTAKIARQLPDLRLTADYSHFACVTESLLERHAEALAVLAPRVDYLHARVGWNEGPQVSDPRTPQNLPYVERFETMWDEIRAARPGYALPVCAEFGPWPYQPYDPATHTPLANVAEIIEWMRTRLSARWKD